MPTAVLIGASTGIGYELAQELDRRGHSLILTARRTELLEELRAKLKNPSQAHFMDVTDINAARATLQTILDANHPDLVIVNAGVSLANQKLDWEKEDQTIRTNVHGAAALCALALNHFKAQGRGHLVGVSSIAGLRGMAFSPSYSASKAFLSNYLEGLRFQAKKTGKPIYVTDIRPGYIDTPMTKGQKNMFWVATAEASAKVIANAIDRKRPIAYVTPKWRIVGMLMRNVPSGILAKV